MVSGMSFAAPVVTEALRAAAAATSMRTVIIASLAGRSMTIERIKGEWPGVAESDTAALHDTFFARLLEGAPAVSNDAVDDPWYSTVPAVKRLGIRSYVGVPICAENGELIGTLCAIDPEPHAVPEDAVPLLRGVAAVVAAAVPHPGAAVIRWTGQRWDVDGAAAGGEAELTNAMVLADLLAGAARPGQRPPKPPPNLDEAGRLKVAVAQLEHALAARVTVEQAIGVLVERQSVAPRAAFDRLRRAARSRGRRVHDLAREVVDSAYQGGVPLPPELAARPTKPLSPAQRAPASRQQDGERSRRPTEA